MSETIFSLLPFAFWVVLTVIPAVRLFGRLGKSRWFAALAILPLLGVVILLWIAAYSDWPIARSRPAGA